MVTTEEPQVTKTKVLIVGGGPTGLFASILLSNCEIPHLLIEQREDVVPAPAAHVISTRTLEIFRQAGLSTEALYGLNHHPGAHKISWTSTLGVEPIGQFDIAGDAMARQSPDFSVSRLHTTNISQHLLEKHLLEVAQQSPFADIRFGTRWQGFVGEGSSRSLLADSSNSIYVDADYVLAADGAGSSVARALEIKKVGPDSIVAMLNLSCEVDISAVTREQSGLLYWLLDPEIAGTIIVHDPKRLSVYMHPLAEPYESYEDFDDARCEQLLAQVYKGVPYRLIHKGVWRMTAQVAERFRKDNVFLVGDSAHRFPPTGGLGLNTGIADAHNLVWKIAAILGGDLSPETKDALLDSYELERKPVAQRNSDVSFRNNSKMTEVIEAVGLDPSKASLVPRIMSSSVVRLLPLSLRETLKRILLKPAKRLLSKATSPGQEGEDIRANVASAIANQREHFSSVGLDLGYVYREGCAVSPLAGSTPENDVSAYVPVVAPGARMPDEELEIDGARPYALDLINYRRYTCFQSKGNSPHHLETFGLPVHEVQVTPGQIAANTVLVRPDGHVAQAGN